MRYTIKRQIVESLNEPNEWEGWVELVGDMGRLDQDAYHRINTLDKTKSLPKPTKIFGKNNNHQTIAGKAIKKSIKSRSTTMQLPDLGATKPEKDKWKKENKCFRCGRTNQLPKDSHATFKAQISKRPKPNQTN